MMEWVQPIVATAGSLLEAAGVLLMIGGIVIATCRYAINSTAATLNPYRQYREDIGKIDPAGAGGAGGGRHHPHGRGDADLG